MAHLLRRIFLIVAALGLLALLVSAFLPKPVPVDLAEVTRGPMRVTVDEEGKTRIRERYVVSAPLGGRLRRIDLDPGDAIVAEQTILAVIEPTDPALLDARTQAEAEARVRAAEAAVSQAGANLERARVELDYAENEHTRAKTAHERGGATDQELDDKAQAQRALLEQYRAAQFARDIARYELELARSALIRTQPPADDAGGAAERDLRFLIRAPISGRVLRVFQESMAVVTPGTPLLEVGDPTDLEIVVDVLSTDAVKVRPGAPVVIEHWGGDHPLEASVRLVEPSAFTKVSALGVEEQRVNVIADFTTPPEAREGLADGFRIEARIVTWEDADVIRIPASALFRAGEAWTVFVVEDGRARARRVEIGHRNGLSAQVIEGLAPGEVVVSHPSDQVRDGVRVKGRGSEAVRE